MTQNNSTNIAEAKMEVFRLLRDHEFRSGDALNEEHLVQLKMNISGKSTQDSLAACIQEMVDEDILHLEKDFLTLTDKGAYTLWG